MKRLLYIVVCAVIILNSSFISDAQTTSEKFSKARKQISDDEYKQIEEICEDYNICYELILAIIEAESGYNPDAVNGEHIGLMQISSKYFSDKMIELGVTDLYDPVQNVLCGVDYISELSEEYDDLYLVLMFYNMGYKAIDLYEDGKYSNYAIKITERAYEMEREHLK